MDEVLIHRNVAVLRVDNPALLDEIRAVVPLEDFVLGRISDTELVIDPLRIRELASRLGSRGLSPLLRKADGT